MPWYIEEEVHTYLGTLSRALNGTAKPHQNSIVIYKIPLISRGLGDGVWVVDFSLIRINFFQSACIII